MMCGNQPADISLIDRRECLLPFEEKGPGLAPGAKQGLTSRSISAEKDRPGRFGALAGDGAEQVDTARHRVAAVVPTIPDDLH